MRKGISPIIASVLLLAVALAVVGIFSGWAPNLAQTVTESTENDTEHQLDCNKGSIEIVSATFYSSQTELAVRNSGRIDLNNLTSVAFNSEDSILGQNLSLSLNQGEIDSVNISTSSKPSYVEVYTKKCGDITDDEDSISG